MSKTQQLYKIGLTGGIGSGKSKLLSYLSTIPGIYTVNLDLFGHAVYQYNPITVRNIANIFGKEATTLQQDGTLTVNREVLGQIAFKSAHNLKTLSTIVSPEIKRMLVESFKEVQQKRQFDVIAVEGAVLIEANTVQMFDELWVTTLSKEDAVKRVIRRNPNLGEDQARARVNRQITDEERLKYATFHYDTSDQSPFEENTRLIEGQLRRLRQQGRLRQVP